jgi:uroporphyrinogen decarboxylase
VGWESSFNLLAEAMGCTMQFPEDSVPQVADHVIKSVKDIDTVAIPDPHTSGRLPLHMEMVKLVKNAVEGEVPLFAYTPGPFTLAGQLASVNALMVATIRNPEYVNALLNLTTEASLRYALANIEAGVDVIVTADPTASGSLISPKTFTTFAAPHLSQIAQAVIKAGSIASLHICGKTSPMLDQMVSTGVRILELDHLVDMHEAKERIGQQVILMGNLNPTELLLNGTPTDVEAAAKLCIESIGQDGQYILSSGCEVPPLTPLNNIRAMVAAAEKYGKFN